MTANIPHPVVTRDRWIAERKNLLAQEKELTQAGDRLAEARRALPWVRMDKDYVFDTVDGPRRLSELFQGKRQLLVQHFMFGPGWEQGCKSCSFMADHLDGAAIHLAHRDIALLVVSRAPLADLLAYKARMGWKFAWASSNGNDFNRDFHVSFAPEDRQDGEVYYNFHMTPFPQTEAPGISIFYKDDAGAVFHTYSTFGRGVEVMMGTYPLVDLTPKGRDEAGLSYTMEWVRHHDRYEDAVPASAGCCAGAKA
ncbi:MAG TPA: thioredoxin family protein [Roseateles sp.]